MSTARLETLIWVLIFAGLLLVGLGLSVRRTDEGLGLPIVVVGAVLALVGVVLIYVRSRMRNPS